MHRDRQTGRQKNFFEIIVLEVLKTKQMMKKHYNLIGGKGKIYRSITSHTSHTSGDG